MPKLDLIWPTALVFILVTMNVQVGLAQSDKIDDWRQFRGPNRDGKSYCSDLLSEWPLGGPTLEWSVTGYGKGYSSLAVVEDRIFTIGDRDDQQLVFALDRKTGRPLWEQAIGVANNGPYGGSRSTPTFANERLFCLSTDGVLICLNAKNGAVHWQVDLVAKFHAKMMLAMGKVNWKFSESPLVDGDLVIVTPGAKEAGMVAFDCASGTEIWRCALPDFGEKGTDGAGYSSAVISRSAGVRQCIQLTGRGLIGVNADTGEFLWGNDRVANDVANIASPLVVNDQVFASTGYQTGSVNLVLENAGNGRVVAVEKYFLDHRVFQNHHGGFVEHEGFVYGGHGHKMGLPICIRLEDGEVMWGPIRNKGKSSASVCFADDHIYFRYQDGLMVLVEATSDGYVEKGSFMIPDVTAESWSHPVIAYGRLYLKEQDRILCYRISRE